jgi:hypothetical protein
LKEGSGIGGPNYVVDQGVVVVGRSNPSCDPIQPLIDPTQSNINGSGSGDVDPPFLGHLVEEAVCRYSSVSEPEDDVPPLGSKIPNNTSKSKKHISSSSINSLGVPKRLKLVEALKEGGARSNKKHRRQKGRGLHEIDVEVIEVESHDIEKEMGEVNRRCEDVRDCQHGSAVGFAIGGVTPTSGINLISGSEISLGIVDETPLQSGEKEEVLQAAKLLSIQKDVGFNFEEPEEEIMKQLVDQELCDRAKKMELEKREGDQ